jgi:hypothetical protein
LAQGFGQARQRGVRHGLSQAGFAQTGSHGFTQAGFAQTGSHGFTQAGFAQTGSHGLTHAGFAQTGSHGLTHAGFAQAGSHAQFTLPQRRQANMSRKPLNRSQRFAQGSHAA